MINPIDLAGAIHIASNLTANELLERERALGGQYLPLQHAEWAMSQEIGYMCANANGTPVVMGGLQMVRPGVMRSWMSGTDEWPSVVREVTRTCRQILMYVFQEDIHRVECVSGEWCKNAHRWYRLLGLELESAMPGYGSDGSTFLMFRRLKPCV